MTRRFDAQLYFANGSQAVHGKFYIASFTTVIKVPAVSNTLAWRDLTRGVPSFLPAQQSSQIGTFDVSVINFFLDALFDNVLLYPVNEYLSLNPLFTFPSLAGTRLSFCVWVGGCLLITASSAIRFPLREPDAGVQQGLRDPLRRLRCLAAARPLSRPPVR